MIRKTAALILMLGVFAAAGVAEAGVKSHPAPGTDFSKFSTYRWKAAAGPGAPDLDRRIRSEVDGQLAKEGLKKVAGEGEAADLEIAYNAGTVDILVAGIDVVAGWWGDLVGVPGTDSNVNGGILFAFYEASTGKVVWTGLIVKRGTTENAAIVMRKRAPRWARQIVANYPN